MLISVYCYTISCAFIFYLFFLFKQRAPYVLRIRDWSSDVCSSDRQVLAGRGASVVAAPVDAAHAREVAAALVVCHRIAAALRARLAPGGVDEAAVVAHRDLGDRHRESPVEADRMLRALDVVGARVVRPRTHAVRAVRHDPHLRRSEEHT